MMKILYLFAAILALGVYSPAKASDIEATLEQLDLFGDVFEKVRKEYVEAPEDADLIESAVNGMLTDLDPHSGFLNKRDFHEMQVQTRGEFGGLGIEVTMRNGLVLVVSPIDDTPAFKAGIKAGDYISHINDEAVMGMTLNDAVGKMRGKRGTEITLTIAREGESEPFDVTVERDVIELKAVRSEIEEDVAYVRITSFSQKTEEGVIKAIEDAKDELGDKMKGLVLDLRNNPGGLLDQAIAVSDIFMNKGEIVSTRGRKKESAKRYNATDGDLIDNKPIVVLINGGSASAAEIVAGALQDHHRAVIMGTRSFGKGSVQTIIPLSHDTAMRLTTSRYYTPSGTSIQAEGITPDVEVEQAKVEYLKKRRRTKEADLRGHLKGKKDGYKKEIKKSKDKNKDIPKDLFGKGDDDEEEDAEDFQLSRALGLVRGIHIYRAK